MAITKMGGSYFYLLLCFVTPAVSFQFTKTPDKPLIAYYKNRTNVELRWEWNLGQGIIYPIKIKRRQKMVGDTEAILATYFTSANTDVTKYNFTVGNNLNGYASFVIKDITNQGTGINVMAENEVYVYKISVDEQRTAREHTDEVELNTFKTPVITRHPRNQTAYISGGTFTFKCAADGKPTPIITWEKIGSSQSFPRGSPLTITNFDVSKVGVYRCTAKSAGIAENALATGYVQLSTCGPGCTKEEMGIEFTGLRYNYEYQNPSYNKYMELKNKIETECLIAYSNKGKIIHKCEVLRFRRGTCSVVAVIELGWHTNSVGPKDPLLQAINDGNFAGNNVKTDFVSPTSSPTQIPTTGNSPPRAKTGISTTVPPESAASCSTAIALCVTIIVILVLSNAVLGFLLWKKNSELREVFTKNLAQMAPNEHPLTASNGGHMAVMGNRQSEVPTAPIYHEILNVSNGPAEYPCVHYQTLDANHMNVSGEFGESSVPCSDQPQCQTYQTLDDATKNVNNPMETSVPENYQALQDVMPPANYSKLDKVV